MSDIKVVDVDLTGIYSSITETRPEDTETAQLLEGSIVLLIQLFDVVEQVGLPLETLVVAGTDALPESVTALLYAPLKETLSGDEDALGKLDLLFGAFASLTIALRELGIEIEVGPAS